MQPTPPLRGWALPRDQPLGFRTPSTLESMDRSVNDRVELEAASWRRYTRPTCRTRSRLGSARAGSAPLGFRTDRELLPSGPPSRPSDVVADELHVVADRLEAEPPVEVLRPVLRVGDEEDDVRARAAGRLGGVEHDCARVAAAAMLLQGADVLDLGGRRLDVHVGVGHDLA